MAALDRWHRRCFGWKYLHRWQDPASFGRWQRIKGLLVSIDAMGCHRESAAKIVQKGGDYLLAVKGNQPTLYQQVRDLIVSPR